MTPEQIAQIRTLWGFNVSWHVIARRLGKTLQECRTAVYDNPAERQALPLEQSQQSLPFDK